MPCHHQISIHAAREGGDSELKAALGVMQISIHAAREGGDGAKPYRVTDIVVFQSTPPVKAATTVLNGGLR